MSIGKIKISSDFTEDILREMGIKIQLLDWKNDTLINPIIENSNVPSITTAPSASRIIMIIESKIANAIIISSFFGLIKLPLSDSN